VHPRAWGKPEAGVGELLTNHPAALP